MLLFYYNFIFSHDTTVINSEFIVPLKVLLLSLELQCNVIVNSLRQTRTVSKVNSKFVQLKLILSLQVGLPTPDAVEAKSLFIFVIEIILVIVIKISLGLNLVIGP